MFFIEKNILIPTGTPRRSPTSNTAADGFLDIVIRDPRGNTLNGILPGTPANQPLNQICWEHTAGPCLPASSGTRGAVDAANNPVYPAGTYTVQIVSRLNNMQENYKNAGQPYTGHTVSQTISFTLT